MIGERQQKKLKNRLLGILRHHCWRTRTRRVVTAATLIFVVWAMLQPTPSFDAPVSPVLWDRDGHLLGARIATDGQWRFPEQDSLPDKYVTALLAFEDRRFYHHPGIDPVGVGRAIVQNVRNRSIVSGGSTLTMQLMRLGSDRPPRSLYQKAREAVLALRYELWHSKRDILHKYASFAPFGGNVVGLDAATWRYYGTPAHQLTWSQAATLAVLPNSPALLHPGRNRDALQAKRDRLLRHLHEAGHLDTTTLALALEEPLPGKPLPLPRYAPHLLDRMVASGHASRKATVSASLQRAANDVLRRHQPRWRANGVHNACALIIDVHTGEVRAYAGNIPEAGEAHSEAVDIIPARRSTGSILKPFLYAHALHDGHILPKTLLPDVPTLLSGYQPKNYYETYDGVVPADRALIRSLNVPMVSLLSRYGLTKFYLKLEKMGLSFEQPPGHYGLTLVLGGAESSLWDIAGAYTGMARTLHHFYPYDGRYDPRDFGGLQLYDQGRTPVADRDELHEQPPVLSAASVWHTFEAMQQLERPSSEGDWQAFRSVRNIAWKTGTSFGFRDAWAVGVSPDYVVAVWVGNADGEGRPGLVGVAAAAPLLFDLFDLLPADRAEWSVPYDEMQPQRVCRVSGQLALAPCPEIDTLYVPLTADRSTACTYHEHIYTDATATYRLHQSCATGGELYRRSWMLLPPLQAHYYSLRHPTYQPVPPYREDCLQEDDRYAMQLIYPRHATRLHLPTELDGRPGKAVFRVAHRLPETDLHWHLDDRYIGTTTTFHEMAVRPEKGSHRLTVVDAMGNRLVQGFEVL